MRWPLCWSISLLLGQRLVRPGSILLRGCCLVLLCWRSGIFLPLLGSSFHELLMCRRFLLLLVFLLLQLLRPLQLEKLLAAVDFVLQANVVSGQVIRAQSILTAVSK